MCLRVCVCPFAYTCVWQVALRTKCGCIARVCFVLLRFTGVAFVCPSRGSVCAGRVCVFTMAATVFLFVMSWRHFWGTLEQEEHPSENSMGPQSSTNNHNSLEKLSTWKLCPSLQTWLPRVFLKGEKHTRGVFSI